MKFTLTVAAGLSFSVLSTSAAGLTESVYNGTNDASAGAGSNPSTGVNIVSQSTAVDASYVPGAQQSIQWSNTSTSTSDPVTTLTSTIFDYVTMSPSESGATPVTTVTTTYESHSIATAPGSTVTVPITVTAIFTMGVEKNIDNSISGLTATPRDDAAHTNSPTQTNGGDNGEEATTTEWATRTLFVTVSPPPYVPSSSYRFANTTAMYRYSNSTVAYTANGGIQTQAIASQATPSSTFSGTITVTFQMTSTVVVFATRSSAQNTLTASPKVALTTSSPQLVSLETSSNVGVSSGLSMSYAASYITSASELSPSSTLLPSTTMSSSDVVSSDASNVSGSTTSAFSPTPSNKSSSQSVLTIGVSSATSTSTILTSGTSIASSSSPTETSTGALSATISPL